jgi:uncharacterized membrane protein
MGEEPFTEKDIEEGRIPAILGYIPPLCFVPLLKTNNPYAQHHGKQALALLLVEILAVLFLTPLGAMAWKLLLLACVVAAFMGAYKAWGGSTYRIPFLDKILQKFK